MRNSELFVLAAKLCLKTGLDYKNDPDIKPHEIDAIEQGLRELRFFQPDFADKYVEKADIVAAGAVRKSARATQGK
jgi:hypothetical protein